MTCELFPEVSTDLSRKKFLADGLIGSWDQHEKEKHCPLIVDTLEHFGLS